MAAAAETLESAIPPLLQQPRTCPINTPTTHTPPYPSYVPRFAAPDAVPTVAIIGAQNPHAALPISALEPVLGFLRRPAPGEGPPTYDIASSIDTRGARNLVVLAYFGSRAAHDAWVETSGFAGWWAALDPKATEGSREGVHGWFREVFSPTPEAFEGLFSDASVAEGAARAAGAGMSGEIKEHGYWGSMRDRMAASQRDVMAGEGWAKVNGEKEVNGGEKEALNEDKGEGPTEGRRVTVRGRRNLCVIRSGQDWAATGPVERKKYTETMHPVLVKGMDFLRDEGEAIGCFDCRLMKVHEEADMDKETDKTFGLAYFDDMAALEKWAREHKTHLDIFGRFLNYAKELEMEVALRLFHEVMVLRPEQQLFEYIGCHEKTGMLSSLR